MKKTILCTYLAAGALVSHALIASFECQEPIFWKNHVVTLCELGEAAAADFFKGELAIECPAGALFPFHITLTGDFLALEPANCASLSLKILKTSYIRCTGPEDYLFSTDLINWKPCSEFFTGDIIASTAAENGKTKSFIEIKLNQRN